MMKEIGKPKKKNLLLLKSAVMFLYVYSFTAISNFSILTTERLSIAIVLLFVVITNRFFSLEALYGDMLFVKKLFAFEAIVLIYCLMLLPIVGNGTGTNIIDELANFLIFAFLAYIAFTNLFISVDELFKVLVVVSVVQSIIIFLTIVNPSFATLIDNLPINNTNNYFDYAFYRAGGYQGGIACITSTGTLQLSLGLVSCIYFITKNQKSWFYIAIYLFISFIMTTVARTGLLLAIVGLIAMLSVSIIKRDKKMIGVFAGLIFVTIIMVFVVYITGFNDYFPNLFRRIINVKKNGLYDEFFGQYFRVLWGDDGIPPLTYKTLFGVLTTSGTSGNGVYVMADGGYVRTYAAIGLPFAILQYAIVFGGLKKLIKKLDRFDYRVAGIVFILYLFIGEFKEPLIIYKRYMIVIAFTFLFLAYKEQRMRMNE